MTPHPMNKDTISILTEEYNKKTKTLFSATDPYLCFYKCWYHNGKMVLTPWACITVSKFDTECCDGELRELTNYEVIDRAKDWARQHLGAKFCGDINPDGSTVPSYSTPNTSANCEILIEPLPFYGTRPQQNQ